MPSGKRPLKTDSDLNVPINDNSYTFIMYIGFPYLFALRVDAVWLVETSFVCCCSCWVGVFVCVGPLFCTLVPGALSSLSDCHSLPDSANGRVTDSKILCPFLSVHMRFLSVPHAVNAFRVR